MQDRHELLYKFDAVCKAVANLNPLESGSGFSLDDIGNGLLFAKVFGDVLKFNTTSYKGAWYYFDGRRWREDSGDIKARQAAERLARSMYLLCANGTSDQQKHYQRLGSIGVRDKMLKDAQKHIAISSEIFDADCRYLNLENGVFDIDSMKLIPHDSNLYLTKMMGVTYNAGASSKEFETFIYEIMQSDESKISFLRRAYGYTLTGKACEDVIFLNYGKTTRNGKSTLSETMGKVFGDYGVVLPADALGARQRNSDAPSENLADLKGARFVHVEEPSHSMRFDEALVKSLTGGTLIKTRKLREANMTFPTTFVMFISANYLPRVDDPTLFSSGRLCVIPFERRFNENERDTGLKDKLTKPEVKSAIFNWLLKGLEEYKEVGLSMPDKVRSATDQYSQTSDKLQLFIDEELIPQNDSNISGNDAYRRFDQWCRECNYSLSGKRGFFDMLRRRNMLSNIGTVNGKTIYNVIRGYRLREYDETKTVDTDGQFVDVENTKLPFD